jgi:hypothetical protein
MAALKADPLERWFKAFSILADPCLYGLKVVPNDFLAITHVILARVDAGHRL